MFSSEIYDFKRSGGKKWLFCSCRRVGFVRLGNCKCAICGLPKNFKFFCAVGKKLKHEAVGSRVGKKSARWSVFSPVFLMSFGQV